MNLKKIILAILIITLNVSFGSLNEKPIRWEFDNFKKLTFKYEQIMSNKSLFPGKENERNLMKVTGTLIVNVKNSEYADIVFKNLKMTSLNVDSLGDTTTLAGMMEDAPEMFIQDLKEDGTINGELNKETEMLSQILFPVLNKKIALGDSMDLAMTMLFNMYGSNIKVKGYNRVKLVSSENKSDHLETVINVSEFTIPENVETKYFCYAKGNSRFDFNSEKGFYTAGEINMNMAFGITKPDKLKSKPDILSLDMNMDMNILIILKLIKVEY